MHVHEFVMAGQEREARLQAGDPAIHQSLEDSCIATDHRVPSTPEASPGSDLAAGEAYAKPASPVMTSEDARQFNTRFPSGLSSEKAGTSISNRSPLSLTIW